jgi:hypothetical protein
VFAGGESPVDDLEEAQVSVDRGIGSACRNAIMRQDGPSTADCMMHWNAQGNAES